MGISSASQTWPYLEKAIKMLSQLTDLKNHSGKLAAFIPAEDVKPTKG